MKSSLALILVIFAFASQSYAIDKNSKFIPGEYLVKLKNSTLLSPNQLNLLSDKLDSYIKTTILNAKIVVVKRPIFENVDSAIENLEKNPLVEYAEPNYRYHLATTPNDTLFSDQWGLINSGQKDTQKRRGFVGMDIGASEAWKITTGSSNIVVAIIDSGINYNHPDLKDNIWVNTSELNGKPGIDDDGNGYIDDIYGYSFETEKESGDPIDMLGHGTHCAGIIGARGNNGQGTSGVNWTVKLMALKFIGESGEGSGEAAIKAIDYAIQNGAQVISNSWGGGDESRALEEAIERANKKGILFIAAAGNDMADNDVKPFFPASYLNENIISVTAIDNQGRLAPFANYGKKSVHIGAPGVNVVSTVIKDYESHSGTSMAAPFVSGVAALLLAHEPLLTHLEIKDRILSTTQPISGLQGKTINRGLVNAYFALTNSQTTATSEDPSTWLNEYTFPTMISSNHPYQNKTNQKFEVKIPGPNNFHYFFQRYLLTMDLILSLSKIQLVKLLTNFLIEKI